jgi:hypothetical protein
MADGTTDNLELVLPEVGASTATWGTKLNSNFIDLDALYNEDASLKVTAGGTGLKTYTAAGALVRSTAATTLAALAIGTARQVLQVNAGATDAQWTSNIDVPGTLDVTGAAVLDSTLTVAGIAAFSAAVRVAATQKIQLDGSTGNTYIQESAANTLLLATGGSARMAIENAQISVGTTFVPSANNTYTLGSAALQWSDFRSVLATFSGAVTCSSTLAVTGAITASSTINGQTVSATAAFTGTASFAGAVTLASTIRLPNDTSLLARNQANSADVAMAKLDTNDRVVLAPGGSVVLIPNITAGSLPAAAAALNGAIVLDTSNNDLIAYINGARYRFEPTGTF